MATRTSSGKSRVVTASMIRQELGNSLARIRIEDGLTWADLGELIGRGDDQTARYADGSAEMGVTTYYRAKRLWNGRFTAAADMLIADAAAEQDGQTAQSCLLKAALALSVALEDGNLSIAEIRANRSTLETARDAIDAQLAKLKPQEVA
jgi:hypothetical protein